MSAKISRILRSFSGWPRNRKRDPAQACDSPASIARAILKAGLSTSELHAIMADADERLLRRRMARLQLQSSAFAEPNAVSLHRLKTVCGMCGYKYRCALQLAAEDLDPAWQDWREYCLNAETLKALGAFGRSYDPECWE